jgi:hypothetical protein
MDTEPSPLIKSSKSSSFVKSIQTLAAVFGLAGDLLGRSRGRGESVFFLFAEFSELVESNSVPRGDPEASLLPLVNFGVRRAGRSNNGFSWPWQLCTPHTNVE